MRQRVRRAVEEIGIAEGDVLRAGRHLPANIFQHHVARHHAKNSVVHRHDRAVPAQMLAAAAGFGVSRDAMPPSGSNRCAYLRSGGKPLRSGTIKVSRSSEMTVIGSCPGDFEIAPSCDGVSRFRKPRARRPAPARTLRRNRLHAQLAQIRFVHRRVQAIET